MWEYSGPKDTTRTKANEFSRDEFDTRIRSIAIIMGEDTPVLAAIPLSSENPPTEVIFVKVQFCSLLELSFLTLLHFRLIEPRSCGELSSSF